MYSTIKRTITYLQRVHDHDNVNVFSNFRSRSLTLELVTILFKFATQIDHDKYFYKGAWFGSNDFLFNFGTPHYLQNATIELLAAPCFQCNRIKSGQSSTPIRRALNPLNESRAYSVGYVEFPAIRNIAFISF